MLNIDYIIICLYLAGVLTVGAVFRKKQGRPNDFFLAGRSMHWFPIGLSIMVTAFSAINYTAFSGEVFSHGLYVALSLPVFILVAFPVIRVVMPLYHRLGVCSAYEYLEKRFDVSVRALASGLFILWRIFWMATALYVPAKVLALLTGLNVNGLILLSGSVVTAYTAAGGLKTVMWTDVFQFFVLAGGLLAGIAMAAAQVPDGVAGIFRTGAAGGLLKPFYPFDPEVLSWDPRIRITLWSSWIGTFVAFMSRYSVDQVVVQRYFSARTLRNAQIGFHLNYMAAIFALLLLTVMGFAMYAHAVHSGILGTRGDKPIAYFVHFVRSLPPGATGLIVAGLMAATMSSMDSGINSCCAAFVTDFYNRFSRNGSPASLRLNRRLTMVFGTIVTLAALSVGRLGSIFEIANKIINGLGSPLLAIFILGMFSKTANSRGMLAGGVIGAVWSAYVSFFVKDIALHYYAVVNLIGTLAACYGVSLLENRLQGGPSPRQLSWTWGALRQAEINENRVDMNDLK